MRFLLFAIVCLIVYGSLYPWQFRIPAASALDILLASRYFHLDRYVARDIIVNLAIYLPLGAAGLSVFRNSRLRFLWPVLLGAALSFSIEIAQAYTPSRQPSLLDIACNTAGAALGVTVAAVLDLTAISGTNTRHVGIPAAKRQRGALTVLAIWVAALIFPLFPVLGRTGIYEKLRLAYHAPLSAITILSFAAMWIAAGRMGLKAFPGAPRWWLFAAILVVPAQLFIVDREPLPAEMIGAVTGAAAFFFLCTRTGAGKWIAWLFPAVILLRGLAPFHFLPFPAPQSFSWIPLVSSLESEWQQGIAILLNKAFWYFAAVWLIHDSGVRLRVAAVWMAQLLAGIEIAQIWLPGRTAEITDPLLALAAGAVLWLSRDRPLHQTV